MGNHSRRPSSLAMHVHRAWELQTLSGDESRRRQRRESGERTERHCRQCSVYVQCVLSDMSISNRLLQPPTHPSSINLLIIIIIIILDDQTCHLVRIVRIQYGFWPFLRGYGRITLWYGFKANYWEKKLWICVAKQNSFIVDTTSFFRKISLKRQGSQVSLISLNPLEFWNLFSRPGNSLNFCCFCYNVLESPWKLEKDWTFFKVIVLNYLYFPKFPLLMMLRFLPITHDLWELPRLTIFLDKSE